jgi:hypothetical protein
VPLRKALASLPLIDVFLGFQENSAGGFDPSGDDATCGTRTF